MNKTMYNGTISTCYSTIMLCPVMHKITIALLWSHINAYSDGVVVVYAN